LSGREVALGNGLDEVTPQKGMRIAHCGLPSRMGGAAFVIARSWLSPVGRLGHCSTFITAVVPIAIQGGKAHIA
jgi:hypothetical protein